MFQRPLWILFFLIPLQTVNAEFQFNTPTTVITEPPIGGAASPCLRDDELEMFFESSGDIYQAIRAYPDIPFITSLRVNELSTSQYVEERPFLSVDALRIYFTRRSGSSRVREIFMATRASTEAAFGAPVSAGPQGPSTFEGSLGSLTGDEKKVYLEVIRKVPPGSGTSLTEQTDIACATRENTSQKFGAWTFLSGVNTLDYERDPFINRDDGLLLFSRLGPVSKLPGTILHCLREDPAHTFTAPQAVGGVNLPNVISEDPFLIFPGSRLYFRQSGEILAAERVLNAAYSLPQITGVPGWSIHYPVMVATTEEDAQQFNFRLFYDSIYLTWKGVSSTPELGKEVLEVMSEGPGRLLVSLRTSHPLPGSGITHPVLYFEFKIGSNGIPGQKRTFRLSNGPQINGIAIERPADGSVQFLVKPANSPSSFWLLR